MKFIMCLLLAPTGALLVLNQHCWCSTRGPGGHFSTFWAYLPIYKDFISYLMDADAVTPSSNTRSYTRRSVPSSPGRLFSERLSQQLGLQLSNCAKKAKVITLYSLPLCINLRFASLFYSATSSIHSADSEADKAISIESWCRRGWNIRKLRGFLMSGELGWLVSTVFTNFHPTQDPAKANLSIKQKSISYKWMGWDHRAGWGIEHITMLIT